MKEDLKRILLNMKYDSKKTLNENLERIILNEAYPLKVITSGGWNGPDSGTEYSAEAYTLKHQDTNYVLINTTINGFSMTLKYVCGEQSLTIQSSPNEQFTGTVLDGNSLEQKLQTEYCSKGKSNTPSFDWMARNDDNYWSVLKASLEKNSPLIPYVKEGTADSGPIYYWGQFVIWRNYSGNFVSSKDPSATAKIDPTNNNGKYVGQGALSDVKLIEDGTNEKMSLLDFISKYTTKKDEKVVDKTKSEVKTTTPKKTTTPTTGWNEKCEGTYSMGCKTPEVGRVQQCLKDQGLYPYRVDDKFGKRTRTAVYNKLGKSSFTDADIETICKTTSGGGGQPQDDFDSDMGSTSGDSTIDDKTWTGDIY